jgi:hypothetical protein
LITIPIGPISIKKGDCCGNEPIDGQSDGYSGVLKTNASHVVLVAVAEFRVAKNLSGSVDVWDVADLVASPPRHVFGPFGFFGFFGRLGAGTPFDSGKF